MTIINSMTSFLEHQKDSLNDYFLTTKIPEVVYNYSSQVNYLYVVHPVDQG